MAEADLSNRAPLRSFYFDKASCEMRRRIWQRMAEGMPILVVAGFIALAMAGVG
jgi:hypothetical protein